MSSVASQVILHPTVSQSLKVLGTNLGRDKLYRAVQYFARFLAWYLLSRGYKIQGARWNALKSHLALARKLMRLGKPVEHLQAALRAAQVAAEPGEQITTICRQLGYFGYLTYDTLVWANAIKFFNFSRKNANRFWLAGILFSITHGLLKAGRLANEVKKLQGAHFTEKGQDADRDVKLRTLYNARDATRHQFIIDLLDVWIPASNLASLTSMTALITSLMAFRQQWLAVNSK
ncbi:peroxisomal biogenesis factor [Fomitopsis serialis]|uniref:peroxisomal biogenesis factor n=1 Tax=Fomitopsis serialis TaxID=139415 RepID=UPI002007AA27|nr:peroxisomal biogenesis factor [Neoantrodia serialis]KAH9937542.1 peroxisomal biogenesis factor [Neoantrodia serialis]